MQETFLLKWKFHQNNIPYTLGEATTEENLFTDVTIVSDDFVAYKANKFVLGACSSVMKGIFMSNPHPNPTIYLNMVSHNRRYSLYYSLFTLAIQKLTATE